MKKLSYRQKIPRQSSSFEQRISQLVAKDNDNNKQGGSS